MIISGKTWLWWSLWLALKPGLKSGHFEEFKPIQLLSYQMVWREGQI